MTSRYGMENASRTRASRRLVVAVLVASLLSPAPVQAVQVAPDRPAEDAAMGDDSEIEVLSEDELERARQFHLMSVYAIETRRVQAAVSLEDGQRAKLAIGAKGLAKKRAREFVQLMKKMAEEDMGAPIGGAEPAKDEPAAVVAPIKSLAELDLNTKAALCASWDVQSKPGDDAEWMKVVKASVTPAQFAQYEQLVAASKLKVGNALLQESVTLFGDDLALTPDQQDKLRSLIVEQRAKAKDAPVFMKDYLSLWSQADKEFILDLLEVEPSKLHSILSPQQFEELDLTRQALKAWVDACVAAEADELQGRLHGIRLDESDVAEEPEALGGARQYQLRNLWAIEISRIGAAVKLDESQQAQLRAGTEGLATQGALEFLASAGYASKAGEPQWELKSFESYAAVGMPSKMRLAYRFPPPPKQRENADWVRLVRSVLTPEQTVQYEQALAAQERHKYQAMVAAGMATLSLDLVLSEEQESQLVALVMDHGAQLNPPYVVTAQGYNAVTEHQYFFMELSQVNAEAIGQILDPQQFDLLGLTLDVYRAPGG